MSQLDLFADRPEEETPQTIQERFETFHRDNPHVYETLLVLVREWLAAGHDRCAIGMLWETLRWRLNIHTTEEGGFVLNDHFRSRYVRLLVLEHPELEGVFELRQLRSE